MIFHDDGNRVIVMPMLSGDSTDDSATLHAQQQVVDSSGGS
jgi:hypothetical protein